MELVGVEYLESIYGPPPQPINSLEDLEAVLVDGLPAFRNDPQRTGLVILDRGWANENLVLEWFPLLGMMYVNRAMVIPLFLVMSEIAASPYSDYIKPKQCGIFAPRRIGWKPRTRLSWHAIAMAVDINWNENSYGKTDTTIRQNMWIVDVFKKHGFHWGGDWTTPDDMHFQYGHKRVFLPARSES